MTEQQQRAARERLEGDTAWRKRIGSTLNPTSETDLRRALDALDRVREQITDIRAVAVLSDREAERYFRDGRADIAALKQERASVYRLTAGHFAAALDGPGEVSS